MCRALIIGAGGVGTVVTQKIAANPVFSDVMLASRTKAKCDAIAAAIGGDRVKTAQVDADKLRFPLTLRRWHEGDWFIPYGMTGRKKVSDYLIDAKVSTPEKQRQFVLLSGDEIVWLVGRRIDDRYRLTRDTENVLRITKEIV